MNRYECIQRGNKGGSSGGLEAVSIPQSENAVCYSSRCLETKLNSVHGDPLSCVASLVITLLLIPPLLQSVREQHGCVVLCPQLHVLAMEEGRQRDVHVGARLSHTGESHLSKLEQLVKGRGLPGLLERLS